MGAVITFILTPVAAAVQVVSDLGTRFICVELDVFVFCLAEFLFHIL